jgi:ribonuclease P protein component
VTKNATSADLPDENELNPSAVGSEVSAHLVRYTFDKKERLCSRRSFDLLFADRKSFNAGRLWLIYKLDLPPELVTSPLMIAFAVPKKSFKRAVDRNLIKRRMREAYRLHKGPVTEYFREKGMHVAFLIKYNPKEILSFKDIEKDMRYALRRIQKLI